jgi:hypothetical protein
LAIEQPLQVNTTLQAIRIEQLPGNGIAKIVKKLSRKSNNKDSPQSPTQLEFQNTGYLPMLPNEVLGIIFNYLIIVEERTNAINKINTIFTEQKTRPRIILMILRYLTLLHRVSAK